MASLQSMKGQRMSFIIVWKVVGELHNLKNMMSGLKNPQFMEKTAFHSSPSLSWTLLKPQQRSRVVNHSTLCNLVSTLHPCHVLSPPAYGLGLHPPDKERPSSWSLLQLWQTRPHHKGLLRTTHSEHPEC